MLWRNSLRFTRSAAVIYVAPWKARKVGRWYSGLKSCNSPSGLQSYRFREWLLPWWMLRSFHVWYTLHCYLSRDRYSTLARSLPSRARRKTFLWFSSNAFLFGNEQISVLWGNSRNHRSVSQVPFGLSSWKFETILFSIVFVLNPPAIYNI